MENKDESKTVIKNIFIREYDRKKKVKFILNIYYNYSYKFLKIFLTHVNLLKIIPPILQNQIFKKFSN